METDEASTYEYHKFMEKGRKVREKASPSLFPPARCGEEAVVLRACLASLIWTLCPDCQQKEPPTFHLPFHI